jgi:ABC-type branched-subunit amino acid transport system permease subunit
MNEQIRNGLRSGAMFGIVTVFLVMVGFNLTAADLLNQALGLDTGAPVFGLPANIFSTMLFFGLIALWAGVTGARRTETDTWGHALTGGLVSGLVAGFFVAVLAFTLGSLNSSGVRLSGYLPLVLPASINQFSLNLPPLTASLTHWALMLFSSFLGVILARGFGRGIWNTSLAPAWQKAQASFSSLPSVQRVIASPITRYVVYGLLLLFVFLLPLRVGQYWNYTIGTVGIYVLLGLGLNIVVGLAGLLDLGYVAFFAIGAYSVALLTAPEPHNLQWSFWVALPIGIVMAALAGILLGIPVLRMRGDYLAIVTLGFGEIIRILSRSDLLNDFTGGPRGVRAIAGPTLFGRPFNSDVDFVYLILLAVLLIIFVTNRLQNSRVGRAWIAMREDETVAQAMGINTLRHKLLAFAIGAAFAGLGGVLFASRNQFTGPEDHNLMVSINVLSVVIVGGMGSIPGVIAGAFALKGLPEVLRQLENYRVMAFGALLVVMMILRPEGLIPSNRRRLEMHSGETDPEVVVEVKEIHPPGALDAPITGPRTPSD